MLAPDSKHLGFHCEVSEGSILPNKSGRSRRFFYLKASCQTASDSLRRFSLPPLLCYFHLLVTGGWTAAAALPRMRKNSDWTKTIGLASVAVVTSPHPADGNEGRLCAPLLGLSLTASLEGGSCKKLLGPTEAGFLDSLAQHILRLWLLVVKFTYVYSEQKQFRIHHSQAVTRCILGLTMGL